MDFYAEVVPVIQKYENRAFQAYDGYGASISFYDYGLICEWEENEGKVSKVTIEDHGVEIVAETEVGFQIVLQMVQTFAELELKYQEERPLILSEFKEKLNKIS
jgi:hypothetical protein